MPGVLKLGLIIALRKARELVRKTVRGAGAIGDTRTQTNRASRDTDRRIGLNSFENGPRSKPMKRYKPLWVSTAPVCTVHGL